MLSNRAFADYVVDQLCLAFPDSAANVQVRERFNAASISLFGRSLALVLDDVCYLRMDPRQAARLLPGSQALQPPGAKIASDYYALPLAWLADPQRLAQCLDLAQAKPQAISA